MENKLFYGSIDLTLLIEKAKEKHSAFTKGKNGHIYASVNVWLNQEKDKFGNIMSIQINPSEEMRNAEKKVYIGNLRESEGKKPVSDRDISGIDGDFDVPPRETRPGSSPATNVTEPVDDGLPF